MKSRTCLGIKFNRLFMGKNVSTIQLKKPCVLYGALYPACNDHDMNAYGRAFILPTCRR